MASRYQTFRRVAAPIAIVLALMLLVREGCTERRRAPVRFVLDFGETAADVRHVRVDLWVGDSSVGYFEASFRADGATAPVRFAQPVPRSEVDATVAVTLASGEVVPVRRTLHVEPGGESVIDAHVP